MTEKILRNFAELLPSYKSVQIDNSNSKNKTLNRDEKDKDKDNQGKSQKTAVTYIADMSEPRTYLAVVLPQLLQLTMPKELSVLIRKKMVMDGRARTEDLEKMTDEALLVTLGFTKAKPGSKYSLVAEAGDRPYLSLKHDSVAEGRTTNVNGGVRYVITIICEAILEDLYACMTDDRIVKDREFAIISNRITYNPFYRIAAIYCALTLHHVPNIAGLLLMDNKLSLTTLAFILRATRIPPQLKQKYSKIDNEIEDPIFKNKQVTRDGEVTYEFLAIDGMYHYTKVKWTGISKLQKPRRLIPSSNMVLTYNDPSGQWK